MSALLIDTADAARRELTRSDHLSLSQMPRLGSVVVATTEPVEAMFAATTDRAGRAMATLALRARLPLRCTHCEQPVWINIQRDARFMFVADEAALDAIDPADEDDDVDPVVGGRRFDLANLIEDEILLALPIAPRHDDCQSAVERQRERQEPVPARHQPFAALGALRSDKG